MRTRLLQNCECPHFVRLFNVRNIGCGCAIYENSEFGRNNLDYSENNETEKLNIGILPNSRDPRLKNRTRHTWDLKASRISLCLAISVANINITIPWKHGMLCCNQPSLMVMITTMMMTKMMTRMSMITMMMTTMTKTTMMMTDVDDYDDDDDDDDDVRRVRKHDRLKRSWQRSLADSYLFSSTVDFWVWPENEHLDEIFRSARCTDVKVRKTSLNVIRASTGSHCCLPMKIQYSFHWSIVVKKTNSQAQMIFDNIIIWFDTDRSDSLEGRLLHIPKNICFRVTEDLECDRTVMVLQGRDVVVPDGKLRSSVYLVSGATNMNDGEVDNVDCYKDAHPWFGAHQFSTK